VKIVFLKEVEGSGRIGEIKNVADGYARNYLLPKGLAAPATPEAIRKAEARAVVEAKRQAQLDEAAQLLAGQMGEASIRIVAKAGSKGRLFGSVTQADIAVEVGKLVGQEVDRHQVALAEPIKETGEYQVTIQLSKNVRPVIAVVVAAEGAPVEEKSEPAAETEAAEPQSEEGEAEAVEPQPEEGESGAAETESES
jgi:large subunit ribosomal protein L9